MSDSMQAVLDAVVDGYRRSGEPVTVRRVAESVDGNEETLAATIESLRECELVEETARGYRPTVTGRELLATDIDVDDVVVIEFVDE